MNEYTKYIFYNKTNASTVNVNYCYCIEQITNYGTYLYIFPTYYCVNYVF